MITEVSKDAIARINLPGLVPNVEPDFIIEGTPHVDALFRKRIHTTLLIGSTASTEIDRLAPNLLSL